MDDWQDLAHLSRNGMFGVGAGRIINPATARSQLLGGMIWGISSALHEATETDREVNAMGIKGVGELGGVGTNAAVCNAIYHATGTRIRELPVRIEKLLAMT